MRTAFGALRLTILMIGSVCLGAGTIVASMAAEGTGMRSGPAAWIEEYWDVKPEKFDEFVRVYKRDVYSISRKVPGYRGYTFLTNIQDAAGYPRVPRTPDKMLTPHYGIHLQGEAITERSIDIGNLLRRTHNVVIIHNLQSWYDAQAFRRNMEQTHAAQQGGEKFSDRLARTLFPLANNYWETSFRLIETGLPLQPAMRAGKDADGLDLEPRPSEPGTGWFKEYFEVTAKDLRAFLDAYKNNTYKVMHTIPGYQGVTIVTTLAPSAEEAARTKYTNQILGGPDQFYVPQPGVMMDGAVRTDTSINYSLLFKPTFTIITYYQFPWSTKMLEEMQKNFEVDHPGQDRLEHITKVFFPHIQNHWDMHYRAIETSFVPVSTDPAE